MAELRPSHSGSGAVTAQVVSVLCAEPAAEPKLCVLLSGCTEEHSSGWEMGLCLWLSVLNSINFHLSAAEKEDAEIIRQGNDNILRKEVTFVMIIEQNCNRVNSLICSL